MSFSPLYGFINFQAEFMYINFKKQVVLKTFCNTSVLGGILMPLLDNLTI